MFSDDQKPLAYFRRSANAVCAICQPSQSSAKSAERDVVRKCQCVECGYKHADGVTLTVEWPEDENSRIVPKPGTYTAWFTCDECGTEQVITARVTKKEAGL